MDSFIVEDQPVDENGCIEHSFAVLLKFFEVTQQRLHQAVIHKLSAKLRVFLQVEQLFLELALVQAAANQAKAKFLFTQLGHQLSVLCEKFKHEIRNLLVEFCHNGFDELKIHLDVFLLLLHLPDLLEGRNIAGSHVVIHLESLWLDFCQN